MELHDKIPLVTCIIVGSRGVGKDAPMPIEFFKKVIDVNLTGSYSPALSANLERDVIFPRRIGDCKNLRN